MFVAIDPGENTGWSLWLTGPQAGLIACGLGDPRSCPSHVVATKQREGVTEAWIESQVIYPRSKARPNDIVKLAQGAGEWSGMYKTLSVGVNWVEPATWKGQLPKDVCHARIWSILDLEEQAIVSVSVRGMAPSKRHNVLDSIGIGLWAANRFGVGPAEKSPGTRAIGGQRPHTTL